jgi:16S rRNA (adenine1518-N6/adenine1519-N6)-dimethyltransferase
MVNSAALDAVADALAIGKGETVLEIGPGLGFLTERLLARGAEVWAVDLDPRFIGHLKEKYTSPHAHFVNSDILEFDLRASLPAAKNLKVIGNIPYNITSPILEWLVDNRSLVGEVAMTVQSEVADRLCAKQGTKAWGSLSLFVQVYADVEIVKRLPADIFYPPPNVTSALVRLRFHPEPRHEIADEALFFRLVRRAFQKRRKTLLNSLREKEDGGDFSKEKVEAALSASRLDPMRRPETLSIPEWVTLVDAFRK